MSRRFLSVSAAILAFAPTFVQADQTFVLKPLKGQAGYTGVKWNIVDTGDPSLSAAMMMQPRYGLLEYPLADLPADATVTSATLNLQITRAVSGIIGPGGPCQLTLSGYAGDGAIEATDATVPTNAIGNTPLLYGTGPLSVSLSVSYLQSLLDGSATHLGLLAYQTGDPTGEVKFLATSGVSPELTITCTPEPSSLCLLAFAGSALIRRRR